MPIAGDSGPSAGNSGHPVSHINVNSLEVYSFAPAVAVAPLPAGGLLLITALGGLAAMRRRKRQS
ncbi:MAG TPA: VPLPA-CTERM sorting domain-containing protein [Roseibacterium sp.]|nr:VPLPA-CTERM sorting domain-containing protein [Roseibacterium sp.]